MVTPGCGTLTSLDGSARRSRNVPEEPNRFCHRAGLPPGTYFVTVKAQGHLERYNETAQLSVGKPAQMFLEIRRSVQLDGVVLDSQGAPVFKAGSPARIRLQLPDSQCWVH
jgi:hypothetical protein